ncbi:CsbD family protein [Desulfuromonas versatilis]|uniref:CsbD family protein n=1 Tax=Desulfuromonas versatilis TaxID=2802975 RepID=A0ABM8HRL3_9BACT|nr:CsbD family protein [Desulfuromonas versatilis]BCR04554.1 CsbD family protein [Desulfuromonas versatilis]
MTNPLWQGQLDRAKGMAREFWGELTGDQKAFLEGRRERMIGRLEAKYGLNREEAEKEAAQWLERQ